MRHWRWLLLGLAIITLVFAAITLQRPISSPEKIKISPADPNHIMVKDVFLSLVDQNDVVRWKLTIKEAKEITGGMTLSIVSGRYFPDKGESYALTAKTGWINKEMDELILSQDVALTQTNYHLTGRQLIWDAKTNGFRLNGDVVLESQMARGEGEHLITDASLKHVRFEGQCVWRSNTNLFKGGRTK